MSDENKTYCISLRFRRTTQEDAYLSVPVCDEIMEQSPDGSWHINPDAMVALGIRLSAGEGVEWAVEETTTAMHPVQQPPPAGRISFDAHHD